MSFSAAFRCIAGCEGTHPLDRVIYRCPRCGDLLEVTHDVEALRSRSATAWMKLFDDRYLRTMWPYGSGVWGKKEWVAPHVRDENVVSMYEGGTNLFWAERHGRELGVEDLWVKQCGNSHTGSFKDLGMTVLVSTVKQMIADGTPIRAVACASTGDTSASLAAYAAAAGVRALVLLPRGKVSTAQLVQPLANGASVLALDTDFDGCMAIVKRLAEEEGVYLANSMNPLRLEGQKTVAIEIVQQFDWQVPDWIIIPGGNLGNVSALGAGFTMMQELGLIQKRPRICVAQAEAANPLYRAYQHGFDRFEPVVAKPTLASAIQIGNPVSFKKAIRTLQRFDGVVEQATEAELSDAAARADRTGMFNCPHTGVALAALEKLVARGLVVRGQKVVVVSTANGLKFIDFKVKYHQGTGRHANRPHELPSDYGVVRDLVHKLVLLVLVVAGLGGWGLGAAARADEPPPPAAPPPATLPAQSPASAPAAPAPRRGHGFQDGGLTEQEGAIILNPLEDVLASRAAELDVARRRAERQAEIDRGVPAARYGLYVGLNEGLAQDTTGIHTLNAGALLGFQDTHLALEAQLVADSWTQWQNDIGVTAYGFGGTLGARFAPGGRQMRGLSFDAGVTGLVFLDGGTKRINRQTPRTTLGSRTFELHAGLGYGISTTKDVTVIARLVLGYWFLDVTPFPPEIDDPYPNPVTVHAGLEFMVWR
jgi:threonine synthase